MNGDWHNQNSNWSIPLAEKRDARITGVQLVESGKLTSLLVWTMKRFQQVAGVDVNVNDLVKMTESGKPERALICGTRNGASFVRKDGLRCNFQIVVRETEDGLEIISYSFHIDVPKEQLEGPRFLRWEFAPDRKPNVDAVIEPLAHMHPGCDKTRLPAPVLTPKELISVFLSIELSA